MERALRVEGVVVMPCDGAIIVRRSRANTGLTD
jgi:hypothetical protein